MEIYLDKLYRDERKGEPLFIGFPLPSGKLYQTENVSISHEGRRLPIQTKVTSRYADGSVRFLFVRFLADIPGNSKLVFDCDLGKAGDKDSKGLCVQPGFDPVKIEKNGNVTTVKTLLDDGEGFSFSVRDGSDSIFDSLTCYGKVYSKDGLKGPELTDGAGHKYGIFVGEWKTVEEGPVCVILKAKGRHMVKGAKEASEQAPEFEVKLTAYAGKPWAEVSYRLINATDDPLEVKSLLFHVTDDPSDGAGQDRGKVRSLVASSNYRTDYLISEEGERVFKSVNADKLMKEANEHFAEVFYGTFFADVTDKAGGVSATVFQAQQNFPKAIEASKDGIAIHLVPDTDEAVVLQSGMSREQRFLLHFHKADLSVDEIGSRSIIYQMPDRPYVAPFVHRKSGVWPEIFADIKDPKVEQNLVARADAHSRAYGILNFGDSYDSNYTAQGRGDGKLVWCNNEYDYPHACALIYARTGIRRFIDYMIASASHWMDVDVCHYHRDPLYIGGQWEHTAGHTINGVMVCSHEWVEGLLDYYHFTGDERGLETATGIGDNILRLLELPMYQKPGEANARETGWALRALTALYIETHDDKWLGKCERIVNDFKVWEETFGNWLAPYTDNTAVRVVFMISIAVGSLMRYYRVFPDPKIKDMIIRAVDDMIENCYVEDWGLFYYKELPSLARLGNNTLVLEALTAAYDLTGDERYLSYGMGTFTKAIEDTPGYDSKKQKIENAVIVGSASSKNFAQSFAPLAGFYRAYSGLSKE